MKDQMPIERFLKRNPLLDISAARIQYTILSKPDLENILGNMMQEKGMETDDMRRERDLIRKETDDFLPLL